MLETAIALAIEAHAGQRDKAGAPYILHPLRVMLRMDSDHARIAAMLHDVVEDSPLTLADLAARGFPPEVVAAVDALTRRDGESYDHFLERVMTDPVARQVKLADVEDNLDVTRLEAITDRDAARLAKYLAARRKLLG